MRNSHLMWMAVLVVAGCGSDGERTQSPRDVQPLAQTTPAEAQPSSPPVVEASKNAAMAAPESSDSAGGEAVASAKLNPRPDAPPAAPEADAGNPVIARLGNVQITQSQITRPLIEGYGLNLLLQTVTLELAKGLASDLKLTVTPADVQAERDSTLGKMFGDASKEDYPNLLDQFLQQQRISEPEFNIVIETNAYLRKVSEPAVKAGIKEEMLQESFKALYGETIQVRHIQCANPQEILEAKRMLAAGEPFEQVARKLSRNPRTRDTGGELPRFSRFATGYPDNFKSAAFDLKVGEISDPVQTGDAYHLIKLEKRFEPSAVKYEDVKESLREDLVERLTQAHVKNLRSQLVDRIALQLSVEHPVLAKQYEAKKSQSDNAVHGREDALEAIKRDHDKAPEAIAVPEKLTPQPPAEGLRPPATRPGVAAPGEN